MNVFEFFRYLFRDRDAETRQAIVKLMERVQRVYGFERSAVCARDCLLEWETHGRVHAGVIIEAWNDYIDVDGGGFTSADRHGAWVPAIPL